MGTNRIRINDNKKSRIELTVNTYYSNNGRKK